MPHSVHPDTLIGLCQNQLALEASGNGVGIEGLNARVRQAPANNFRGALQMIGETPDTQNKSWPN